MAHRVVDRAEGGGEEERGTRVARERVQIEGGEGAFGCVREYFEVVGSEFDSVGYGE